MNTEMYLLIFMGMLVQVLMVYLFAIYAAKESSDDRAVMEKMIDVLKRH